MEAPQRIDAVDLPDDDALEVLAAGELEVLGRLVSASNATLLATVTLAGVTSHCVYKPVAGERPLWDFPTGTLARREVAAYLLSCAGGWPLVPPTLLRDGPYGMGSVQWWVGEQESALIDVVPAGRVPKGWLTVLDAEDYSGAPVSLIHADDDQLREVAVFDAIANNADRKGSHLIRQGSVLRGVDHGLTFHTDEKLRTVLWGWGGAPLSEAECELLAQVGSELEGDTELARHLRDLIDPEEYQRLQHRVTRLRGRRRMPRPGSGHPAIPWPPL